MPGMHAAVASQPPSRFIAFDDDDDGFGDFKFVSVAAQPVPPHQSAPLPQQQQQDDDDWGDFVVSPAGSQDLGTLAPPPSSFFDPFPPAGPPTDARILSNGAKLWEKPRGALPLSIFGEEEAELEAEAEEPSQAVEPPVFLSVSFPSSNQAAKDRKGLLAGGELKDLISSLYGQATPQSKGGEKAGSSLGEGKEDDLEECSWEFKDSFSSSPNSVLKEDGIQKESGLVSIAVVDFTKAEVISDMWKNNLVDWPIHSYSNFGKEADGRSFSDQHGHSSEPIFPGNAVKDDHIPSLDLFIEADQGNAIYPAKDASKTGQNSDIVNSCSSDLYKDHGLDGDHWEFPTTPGVVDRNQNSAYKVDKYCSNKLTYSTVVDFYQRLKDGSISLLNCHLNGLKQAYEVASFSGQQVKAKEINEEIEEVYKKLQEVKGTENDTTGKHLPIDVSVNQLLEAVEEPNFQAFVQEYQLSERIISAGKKSSAAIKFLEHTSSVLLILALGSKEDQRAYISAWSDLVATCAEELEHGAIICQESIQAQSFMQLLVKECKYFIALGEIYRVAEVLKASSKVYKPWILLNQAATASKLSDSLDKCDQAWNLYGLEDALKTISDSKDLKHAGLAKAVLASIKIIHELDLSHCPFSHGKKICAISLLSTQELQGAVPMTIPTPPSPSSKLHSFVNLRALPNETDMKMELWCGKHYFVKLANLWANRVSCEAPQLPFLYAR